MKINKVIIIIIIFCMIIHPVKNFSQIIFDDFSYKSTDFPVPDQLLSESMALSLRE